MAIMDLPGLRLEWGVAPASWTVEGGALTAAAAPGTDIFASPFGWDAPAVNAARALAVPPDGPWQLQARLRVGFRRQWDAGALVVWADERHWGKVNFELAPDGGPTVFSVVTRDGSSDDAVGWAVDTPSLWLRVSALDGAYAFHASGDGRAWRLVRQFGLAAPGPVRAGLEVQSPVGEGCTVVFDEVRLTPTRLAHLFDGR